MDEMYIIIASKITIRQVIYFFNCGLFFLIVFKVLRTNCNSADLCPLSHLRAKLLTRSCEIEHDNLKQNQVKVKQWYDKDAMIR
jgi:hypothetical protein